VSDELKLIDAAKDGSVEAFTELVHGYRERLFRFLLTRCASHADAEDALQDTLINAYRYIGSYNPQWRFSTWLYRIAIRNAGKLRAANLAELGDLADESADPLAHCIADSERDNLWPRPVGRGVCGDVAALCRGYVGAGYRERSRAIVFVDQG
jgi:RNA polymerase sigma-70 factor (ECF subfamily)